MALSKNRIKYIRSLELKKNRKADKVFLAEGPKLVGDLLGHFRCRFLIATAEWLSAHKHLSVEDITEVSEEELSRASLLKTPQQVLAVFEQPGKTALYFPTRTDRFIKRHTGIRYFFGWGKHVHSTAFGPWIDCYGK